MEILTTTPDDRVVQLQQAYPDLTQDIDFRIVAYSRGFGEYRRNTEGTPIYYECDFLNPKHKAVQWLSEGIFLHELGHMHLDRKISRIQKQMLVTIGLAAPLAFLAVEAAIAACLVMLAITVSVVVGFLIHEHLLPTYHERYADAFSFQHASPNSLAAYAIFFEWAAENHPRKEGDVHPPAKERATRAWTAYKARFGQDINLSEQLRAASFQFIGRIAKAINGQSIDQEALSDSLVLIELLVKYSNPT